MNDRGAPEEWFDAALDAGFDEDPSPESPAGAAADCGMCPLGFLRDVSREAQPEVTLHLLAAARELLLAMETVVRAAEQTVQHNAGESPDATSARASGSAPQARVRRIDIA